MIGKAIKVNRGLINVFNKAKTIAIKQATPKFFTYTSGNRYVVSIITAPPKRNSKTKRKITFTH